MANGVDIFQAGRTWTVKFHSGAGTALPATLCTFDLIPKRLVYRTDTAAVAGNGVVIQSQPTGGTATDVYKEIVQGAFNSPVEQRPQQVSWSGPVVITQFDNGELLIDLA